MGSAGVKAFRGPVVITLPHGQPRKIVESLLKAFKLDLMADSAEHFLSDGSD
jgi:hypothetical protein